MLLLSLFACACAAERDPVAEHIRQGRDHFQNRQYDEALYQLTAALTLKPADKTARFMAGLAAYWARQPELALDHWNAFLDSAKRNTEEEFQAETHRVMALSAMKQIEAAESVVERIYELRRDKVKTARESRGYVREHFYIPPPQGGIELRAGVWEAFDDRGEMQEPWVFPVYAIVPPAELISKAVKDEPLVKRLSVKNVVLPGGKPGFVLLEEGAGYTRVYKQWAQRPDYREARAVLIEALRGKLLGFEEKTIENEGQFAVIRAAPLAPPVAANTALPAKHVQEPAQPALKLPDALPERKPTASDLAVGAKLAAMGLDPEPARMLTIAARLLDVDFDITRLTRLSMSDAPAGERYIQELKARSPFAQEDAAELVDLVNHARSQHVATVFEKIPKLGARKPYLDYVLLTALNTRGKEMPQALLKECLLNPDLLVRQTAALMLARLGDRKALGQLFLEIEQSDAGGLAIINVALEELLGDAIGTPPPDDPKNAALIKAWQQQAAKWWRHNESKLKHNPEPGANQPWWK